MGPDLHHGLHPEFRQRRDGFSECHRLAHLAAPVRTVKHILRRYLATRHRADVGEGRWRDRDVGERFLQIVQHRFHQRAVVGGALSQAPHLDILLLQAREQCIDLRGRSAHHLVGAVVGRNTDAGSVGAGVVFRYRCRHDGSGGEHSRHCALARQRRHQAPARGCKAQARLQAEYTRRLRRRQFSETVSDHDVGANPETRPERRQCALHRVNCRLGPGRVVDVARVVSAPEHDVQERCAPQRLNDLIAAVENGAKDRFGIVQIAAHADPLAGLTRIGESHLSGQVPGRFAASLGVRRRKRMKARPQGLRIAENQSRPVAEMASSRACGPGHVGKQRIVSRIFGGEFIDASIEPAQIPRCQVSQRVIRAA